MISGAAPYWLAAGSSTYLGTVVMDTIVVQPYMAGSGEGTVLCVIRVMLRRIYCYVLTQRVIGNWDAHSQGSAKHQLPIVAVIASGQLLQGVYLRTIVIRGEIPWSGVMLLWCWKGGRFANSH